MILSSYLANVFSIILNSWMFIVIGIIANLILEAVIPKKIILSNFGKKDFFTIIRASVSGLLVSGLSFGVVPLVASLRKNGASISACAAMLAFTPWTGAFGLIVIGGYVGMTNLLVLLGCSFLLSIMLGFIFSLLEGLSLLKHKPRINENYLKEINYSKFSKYLSRKSGIKEISASVSDILKNVFIAVLLTAFFQVIFTADFIAFNFSSNYASLYSIPLATLIEIIGEGFTLFAGEIYLSGASLGAVFSIIMAGVITDINELRMLAKIFSKRAATAYLIIGLALTVAFSFLLI
ncbi:MAG: permease [Candidatus Nanoarchaeia archaeon]|nr:permease [Candidatus Nanoarchaeia archaeon]